MKNITLENDLLKATFDEQTGALLELKSKSTEWLIQKRPELALSFRLLVPLPDRRNNPVFGEKQKLSRYWKEQGGKRVTFVWNNLQSKHGGMLDIAFEAIVTLSDAGLTFEGNLENHSRYTVETVSYPCLGDIPMPSSAASLKRMNFFYYGMQTAPLLPEFQNERGYWGVDYPIQMVPTPDSPFVLVSSERQGLYVGCHDTSARELIQFTFELKPGYENSLRFTAPQAEESGRRPQHLELTVIHFPFVAPGGKVGLSPILLMPYVGSWHKGVDCYKRWRQTWFQRPITPDWAQEVHSWHQIHINSIEDELRCRYKDLVKYGKDCVKHGVGVIQLVGWTEGGQDGRLPSHEIDLRLGTWEELRNAIAEIQAMGVKVILYTKFTFADYSMEWFKKELHQYASKDALGNIHSFAGYQYQTPTQLSFINTRRLAIMCMNSAKWRQIACREFQKSIELGSAGILYDECQHHGIDGRYCFDPGHGHPVPAYVYAGDAVLAEDLHSIAGKIAGDFLFAGEGLYELQYRHYSLSYFRIGLSHIPVQRYIDPYAGIMVAATGYNDRDMINLCLLYRYIISYEPRNFKGSLDEFPMTIEYGKKVDALRKRYKQYLWDAEFRDILGVQVTANGKPHYPFSVFWQAESGKRAVVVVNQDGTREIKAAIELEKISGPLVLATPEDSKTRKTNGMFVIPPRSAAVVMER